MELEQKPRWRANIEYRTNVVTGRIFCFYLSMFDFEWHCSIQSRIHTVSIWSTVQNYCLMKQHLNEVYNSNLILVIDLFITCIDLKKKKIHHKPIGSWILLDARWLKFWWIRGIFRRKFSKNNLRIWLYSKEIDNVNT